MPETIPSDYNPYAGFNAKADYHPILQNAAFLGKTASKVAGPIGYVWGAAVGAVAGALSRVTGVGRPNNPYIVDIENARAAGTPVSDLSWSMAGYGPGGEGYLTPWADATKTGPQLTAMPKSSLFAQLAIGLKGPDAAQAYFEKRYGGGPFTTPAYISDPYAATATAPAPQVVLPSLQPVSQTSLATLFGALKTTPQSGHLAAFYDYIGRPQT